MDFRPLDRRPNAFQKPVSAEEIQAICRRAWGPGIEVASAIELGGGLYNNTHRITLRGEQQPVILRVAPADDQQFRSERHLMRREYASAPYLAGLGGLLPRMLYADWSHEVIGRDWMLQTHLDGIPAPDRLGDYPRELWPGFFRQLGEITATVHAVHGPHFGPVGGLSHGTWSEAVLTSLSDIAADLDAVGLDATDLRQVTEIAVERRAVLDEITEPRMTLGDLWTVNVMLDATAAEPRITGVFDCDRTAWGDPLSDWTIRMALHKQDERNAFWDAYGWHLESASARWRQHLYEARHLGAIRLERHRLDNGDMQDTYGELAVVLSKLA